MLVLVAQSLAADNLCLTGERQSPVDIRDSDIATVGSIQLELYNVNRTFDKITLTHDRDRATLTFSYDYPTPFVTVTPSQPLTELNHQKPLVFSPDGKYYLKLARIYWGSTATTGSNHAVNGRRYVGEIEWVFQWSSEVEGFQYEPYHGSSQQPADEIRLVTLLEKGGNCNKNFEPVYILSNRAIEFDTHATTTRPFNMAYFITSNVVAYRGSQTGGGCSEMVAYFVLRETIRISERQMSGFRRWLDKTGAITTSNTRPVQPLNDRALYAADDEVLLFTYGSK